MPPSLCERLVRPPILVSNLSRRLTRDFAGLSADTIATMEISSLTRASLKRPLNHPEKDIVVTNMCYLTFLSAQNEVHLLRNKFA